MRDEDDESSNDWLTAVIAHSHNHVVPHRLNDPDTAAPAQAAPAPASEPAPPQARPSSSLRFEPAAPPTVAPTALIPPPAPSTPVAAAPPTPDEVQAILDLRQPAFLVDLRPTDSSAEPEVAIEDRPTEELPSLFVPTPSDTTPPDNPALETEEPLPGTRELPTTPFAPSEPRLSIPAALISRARRKK